MAKPFIHAMQDVKRWGGKPEDTLPIHQLLDSTKGTIADSRHRAVCHNSFFLSVMLEKIFGVTLTNSDGRVISVRDVGEAHVLSDFGGKFIPSLQDYLQEMEIRDWMVNGQGEPPTSFTRVQKRRREKVFKVIGD